MQISGEDAGLKTDLYSILYVLKFNDIERYKYKVLLGFFPSINN